MRLRPQTNKLIMHSLVVVNSSIQSVVCGRAS